MALVGNKADLHENREVPVQVSVILCLNASAFPMYSQNVL